MRRCTATTLRAVVAAAVGEVRLCTTAPPPRPPPSASTSELPDPKEPATGTKARLDAKSITAGRPAPSQQLAQVAAKAFTPGGDVTAVVKQLEALVATVTDDATQATVASLIRVLRKPGDKGASIMALRRCVTNALDSDNRDILDAIFKAADALQPHIMALSAEVKAVLADVEAAIRPATPEAAQKLQELALCLREKPAAALEILQSSVIQNRYAVLAEAVRTAIVDGTFADRLSAAGNRSDVFDLSEVFFKTPVAGSPCLLRVSVAGGFYLPLRAESSKLSHASQFVENQSFTEAITEPVNRHNVESAIAIYGDSGAGKTMLATWGARSPVLYFEGRFHVGYEWGVRQSSNQNEKNAFREQRGKYVAALVLLQVAKKLAELGILEAPRTASEPPTASDPETHEARQELSQFADGVIDELRGLKKFRQFDEQDRVAVVFDEQGSYPTFVRCIRDGAPVIRSLLKEWLNAVNVPVIISGTGLRAAVADDSRPEYLSYITVQPTLTFGALLSAQDEQRMKECLKQNPRLESDYKAVLTNARLAVVAASQITSAFRGGAEDLRHALRAAMETFCSINRLRLVSPEGKSDASILAVALFLFQKDDTLSDGLLRQPLARTVCCQYGMVVDLRDVGTEHGAFDVSPAQWLLMVNNYGAPLSEQFEASMSDVVALTLRAAACAGASIRQWLVALQWLLTDTCMTQGDVSAVPVVEGFDEALPLVDKDAEASVMTRRTASRLHPTSPRLAARVVAEARDRAVSRNKQRKIVVLRNTSGATSADIVVLFPNGQSVLFQVKHLTKTRFLDVDGEYAKMGSLLHAELHLKKKKAKLALAKDQKKKTKLAKEVKQSATLLAALKGKPFLGSRKVLYSVIATPAEGLSTDVIEALNTLDPPCMATCLRSDTASYPRSLLLLRDNSEF